MITHLNKKNQPRIVDIKDKKMTKRVAEAQGIVILSVSAFKKLENMHTKKGNISNVAIVAGIMGAKKTSDLIPLCHNINIENIDIDINTIKKDRAIIINSKVHSFGKTGVEMEALTAVSIACLTIYDMCKSIDKSIIIKEIKLLSKKGGKEKFTIKKKGKTRKK